MLNADSSIDNSPNADSLNAISLNIISPNVDSSNAVLLNAISSNSINRMPIHLWNGVGIAGGER